jgi:hypothetical protein
VPLDPGEHSVTTQVNDGPLVEERITVGRGEKKTVELKVKLEPPAVAAARAPRGASEQSKAGPVIQSAGNVSVLKDNFAGAEDAGMDGRRVGALIAGGVGVAGLALGGITGAMALSKSSTIREHCVGAICDEEGKAAADAVKVPATLSSIGFGLGAAGIGAGVVLWLTAPSRATEAVKPAVQGVIKADIRGPSVGIKGAW